MKSEAWFGTTDRLIAGSWWWKFRRAKAENKINLALEDSLDSDLSYKEWKRYEFACEYGRTANENIISEVKAAERAGMDKNALALLVANRDVIATESGLRFRQGAGLKVLASIAKLWCLFGALLFATFLAIVPIPMGLKIVAFILSFSILIGAAYVFELYTSRPLKAAAYLTENMKQANCPTHTENVVPLIKHPKFRKARVPAGTHDAQSQGTDIDPQS